MNRVLKVTLPLLAAALIAFLFLLSYFGGKREDGRVECRHLRVTVTDSLENDFATPQSISEWLSGEFGELLGRRLDTIDIGAIEKALLKHPAVESAEVFCTRDSSLNVILTQKHPFARFDGKDKGFYIDREGNLFPLQGGKPSKVIVVEGNIPLNVDASWCGKPESEWEREWLDNLIRLLEYIDANPEWSKVIGRITVDEKADIVLLPISGKEKFIFGQATGIAGKFGRIRRYYTQILPAKGAYSSVNVKFDGQTVCRK